MKLDMDKLSKYDLRNAKVGDRLIICHHSGYDGKVTFEEVTIKSISPKRGDITFDNRNKTRIDKYGRRIGGSRWCIRYYTYLECTQENMAIINSYQSTMNKVRRIVLLFDAIEECGFRKLYDLPEDKINTLYETMAEIFEVSENE